MRTPNKESVYLPTQHSADENQRREYKVDPIDCSFKSLVEADSAVDALKIALKQQGVKPLPKIKKERGSDVAICRIPSELSYSGYTTVWSWQCGVIK